MGRYRLGYYTTKQVEEISIAKLEKMVRKTGKRKLDSSFDKNDKGPSWDGFLIVYDEERTNNKTKISSRIPVQIKGTELKKFNKKFKSYPINLSDLKNYFNDGGVIYIVVEIEPETEKSKIFYKLLLPVDIQRILEDAEKKNNTKTINVKLNSILDENVDFYSICKIFEVEKQHQSVQQVKKAISLEQVEGKNLEFVSITDPLDVLNRTIYPYVRDEYNCLVPLKDSIEVDELKVRYDKNIAVGDKTYFDNYEEHYNADGSIYYSFGDHIVLRDGIVSLKQSRDNILLRLNSVKFLLDNINNSNKEIDEKLELEKINMLVSEQARLLEIIKKCEILGIDLNYVRTKDFTSREYSIFETMNLVSDKSISFEGLKEVKLINVDLFGKKYLLLKAIYSESEEYYNYYSNGLDICVKHSYENRNVTASKFMHLKCDDLLCNNFDKNIIIDSFKIIKNEDKVILENVLINFSLELISAWDRSKRDDYLSVAEQIYDIISDCNEEIIIINLAQLEYRRNGKLDYRTLGKLINIQKNTNVNEYLAAIYILLDDKALFNKYFESLTVEEKEKFIKYPIYSLYTINILE